MMRRTIFAFLIAYSVSISAQGLPTVTGAGYGIPNPVVAPGQIVTLQVAGIRTLLSPASQQAASVPLPKTLGGISVTVSQSVQHFIGETASVTSYKAAIVSLNQVNLCFSGSAPDCMITYVTAQMPYELLTAVASPPIIRNEMVVSENGVDGTPQGLGVLFDRIHVVTNCENQPNRPDCSRVVAHLDGTLVSAGSPALPGETVVVYAWGLGNTTPPVQTGTATPSTAPVVNLPGFVGPLVRFDFSPNAAPARYFPGAESVKAYLTPGFVGLYQINIELPAHFPDVPQCGQGGVQSNLTIDLGGPSSFDGAPLCVRPGSQE